MESDNVIWLCHRSMTVYDPRAAENHEKNKILLIK